MGDALLVAAAVFVRTIVGILLRPYETYRRIIRDASLWELPFIAVLLGMYFALASIVKTASFRPFLLTKQFLLLAGAAGATFLFVVGLMWVVGRIVGGKGQLGKLTIAWGYTLVPTVIWFLATSLLYVALPPPRTTSIAGVAFSLLFLVFSATLFFWKGMLTYLTMRFGLKLDLPRIAVMTAICLPIIGIYSLVMYRMGIFRVPFL